MIVAPGFIDTHSHSDLEVMVNPYVEAKVRQGVTTELLGQDGISMAPLPKKYISPWRKNLAGLDGDNDDLGWDYETTDGYLRALEANGVGLNESYLVPHGNIRMEAMGLDNRKPSPEELARMRDITRREMEVGAFGLSTGLIYMPCAYAETSELIELCKVVAEFDGAFVVHQRSEADTILASMEEVIRIGRESGVKIHFSHFKVCGRKNWPLIDQVVALLESATAEGIRTSFDQYPYVAGSTMLGVILPPWAHDGGTDQLLQRLRSPELRQRMIDDIERGIPGWDNFVDFAGFDQIFVTSVKTGENQDLVGKSLQEIGEIRGSNPYDAAFDLLLAEENAVGMVDFYGTGGARHPFSHAPGTECLHRWIAGWQAAPTRLRIVPTRPGQVCSRRKGAHVGGRNSQDDLQTRRGLRFRAPRPLEARQLCGHRDLQPRDGSRQGNIRRSDPVP